MRYRTWLQDSRTRCGYRLTVCPHNPAPSIGAKAQGRSYRNTDATSIINGMSSENPALLLFRWIECIWSPYEVMGDRMMNRGATKPENTDRIPPILSVGADGIDGL